MEPDSGYHTEDGENIEDPNMQFEYDPVFYSSCESGYSDTEYDNNEEQHFSPNIEHNINTPEEQHLPNIEHEVNTPEEHNYNPHSEQNLGIPDEQQVNEITIEQNLGTPDEQRGGEGIEHVGIIEEQQQNALVEHSLNTPNEQQVHEETEHSVGMQSEQQSDTNNTYKTIPEGGIFEMELEGDEPLIDRIPDVEYLEKMLEQHKIEMEEMEANMSWNMFMNENFPEEYKWTEYEECTEEWRNPNLARKMVELRKQENNIDREEIAKVYHELQISKMEEKHELEKGSLIEDLNKVEEKGEKLFTALRIEIQLKEMLESKEKQLKAEIEVKVQELELEKAKAVTWERLTKERENEIDRITKENIELRKEISELRITMYRKRRKERYERYIEKKK